MGCSYKLLGNMKLVSLICFLPYLKSNLNLFNSCKEHSYFMQNFAVLVHSGSRHEVSYPSGVSHCLERLGFAGSSMFKTRDDVMQAVEKLGGICDCQSSRYHYFLLTFCSLLCDSLKTLLCFQWFSNFFKILTLRSPEIYFHAKSQNLKSKKKRRGHHVRRCPIKHYSIRLFIRNLRPLHSPPETALRTPSGPRSPV